MSTDDAGAWRPLDGNIVRRCDMLDGYAVRWAHADPDEQGVLWVDFAIYEVIGQDLAGRHLYRLPDWRGAMDNTTEIDAAGPLIDGFVKWDGCTQWHQSEGAHIDDLGGLRQLFAVIELARRVAAEMMPATDIALEYG